MENAKLFLTDYASYNEGTQFEFGHWVDLTQFNDEYEFSDYISNHFKECDKKSPLYSGIREETMFTDFEGFPSELYSESMCHNELEKLFQWINLMDQERVSVSILLEKGYDMRDAINKAEEINPIEYNGQPSEEWEIFEMYFPEVEEISNNNPYLSIDYSGFIRDEFSEFSINGQSYLVADYEL